MPGKSLIRAAIQVAARRRRDQRIVPYAVRAGNLNLNSPTSVIGTT